MHIRLRPSLSSLANVPITNIIKLPARQIANTKFFCCARIRIDLFRATPSRMNAAAVSAASEQKKQPISGCGTIIPTMYRMTALIPHASDTLGIRNADINEMTACAMSFATKKQGRNYKEVSVFICTRPSQEPYRRFGIDTSYVLCEKIMPQTKYGTIIARIFL